ncbi:acyl carrier protein [bacterium]|nr:acyl carrier protein [bacterium]MCI0602276.1 acyl carrier protein [bacterium]
MKEKVREKIAAFLNQPLANIEDEAILTSLVPESFLLVELVIELQEEFGVRLMQDDLKNVRTVGDLAAVVEQNAKKT